MEGHLKLRLRFLLSVISGNIKLIKSFFYQLVCIWFVFGLIHSVDLVHLVFVYTVDLTFNFFLNKFDPLVTIRSDSTYTINLIFGKLVKVAILFIVGLSILYGLTCLL